MANPLITTTTASTFAESAASRTAFATGARAATASPALIEIGEQPVRAIIVREGIELKTPTLNKDRVSTQIDKLKKVPVRQEARAIDQSVPPGIRVPKGTVIDLVFAPPSDIDIGVLGLVHADLVVRPITDLAILISQPAVQEMLIRVDDPTKLTAEDRTALQAAVTTAELSIQLDPNPQSDKSADRLFVALVGAKTFL